MKTVADFLSDLILYGDIHEAPIQDEMIESYNKAERDNDIEAMTRISISSSFLALARNIPISSVSSNDDKAKDILSRII